MTTTERNATVAAIGHDDDLPDEALQDAPHFTPEEAEAALALIEGNKLRREKTNEVNRRRHVLAQIVRDVVHQNAYHGDDDTSIVAAFVSDNKDYAIGHVFTFGGKLYTISVMEQTLYGFELRNMAEEIADRNHHVVEMKGVDVDLVGSVGVCTACNALLRLSTRQGPNTALALTCPAWDGDDESEA